MSKRKISLYIDDINDSIKNIEEFTKGVSFEKFSKSRLLIDATVRNLEVIGEAARNIPKEIRVKYPQIEWRDIVGMRNRIIHEYFGVDLEIIWKAVKEELPELKKQIKK